MPSKYDLGYEAGMSKALPGMIRVLDKLADARRDSAEWKEQHENLLAMFRASENRAAAETARADANERDARRLSQILEDVKELCKAQGISFTLFECNPEEMCHDCGATGDEPHKPECPEAAASGVPR